MSTNKSYTGLSIKINEDKTDKKSVLEIAKFLGYSESELENFNSNDYMEMFYDDNKNSWRITTDYNNKLGIIYLIDNEYDVFDLNFKMSLEKINELMGLILDIIPKEYLNMNGEDVNVFAYLYYNGSDNPFTF